MTTIVDRHCGRGVHVLIIGVGVCSASAHPLPGVAESSVRLAQWWADSNASLLDGMDLASIEMFVSSPRVLKIERDDGTWEVVDRATFKEVGEAVRRWAARSRPGDLSILHWIGHADLVGQEAGQLHALYCEDADAERDQPQAFDWNATRRWLDAQLEGEALYFVDTCREHNHDSLIECGNPWQERQRKFVSKGFMAFAAEIDQRTWAIEDLDDDAGFPGGALFSEAVRSALNGYGASSRNKLIGSAIYTDTLESGVRKRLQVWKRDVTPIARYSVDPVFQGGKWRQTEPMFKAPRPRSVVDLIVAGCDMRDTQCHVEPSRPDTPLLRPLRAHHEADLAHGEWTARAVIQNGRGAGEHEDRSLKFTAHEPYQVEVIQGELAA